MDDPQEAWLPITESRSGNVVTAVFHLLSSGIGIQALLLPVAFATLGWAWGAICLSRSIYMAALHHMDSCSIA
ncbi:LYSINE HISTIDINE TRANSPORTER-LIKE 7 [Salix viminalis]|uniref:LYSINE HISTIDINE TRANSPORTER-LIKE 7 n=1 Tax=Salix viminalis TaxID=40686 RepID=A0A9Q0QKC5_SALVM|nr:LYSINE HISTIDINE TRANSPORTER-LIKE 7 [Salix viminalis]